MDELGPTPRRKVLRAVWLSRDVDENEDESCTGLSCKTFTRASRGITPTGVEDVVVDGVVVDSVGIVVDITGCAAMVDAVEANRNGDPTAKSCFTCVTTWRRVRWGGVRRALFACRTATFSLSSVSCSTVTWAAVAEVSGVGSLCAVDLFWVEASGSSSRSWSC